LEAKTVMVVIGNKNDQYALWECSTQQAEMGDYFSHTIQ